MKRLFLACAIATVCLGLCSLATANPTLTLPGSSQSESTGTGVVTKDSDGSEFFLKEWLYWLLDDVFGWDRSDGKKRYYPRAGGLEPDSGQGGGDSDFDNGDWDFDSGDWDWDSGSDNDWGSDSGDDGLDGDPGDDGSGNNPGDDDWGFDPDNDGWEDDSGGGDWDVDPGTGWDGGDSGTSPPQTIPAPGALVLGGIGSCLVTWLRRRKAL